MDETQMMRHVKRIKKEHDDVELIDIVHSIYMQGWRDATRKIEEIIKKNG
jgi:hypothetical protein